MAQTLKVEDQESGSEIRMAGVTEQCIPALHLITIITWQLRDEGQDVCLLQFFSNDHPLGTERVIPVDAGPVGHKNSSGARDQVFSFEFARPARRRRPRRGMPAVQWARHLFREHCRGE